MLGVIILAVLILTEISFTVMSLSKKSNFRRERSIARIALFAIFLLLVISPIANWGFQWYMLALVLGVQAILGVIVLVRKKENAVPKKSKVILTSFNRLLLIVLAVFPILIFPKYDQIKPTGEYLVGTKSYTLTDVSREEYFTQEKDNRKVTIQYWYPEVQSGQQETIAEGKFPLVIFSHGAFGYRMSNYSTYQELASHGYIVCSIDTHTTPS
jgi:heme/copper-type cytochrome/quinol oxidase subunit 2